MPWLLDPHVCDHRQVSFTPYYDKDGNELAPASWDRPQNVPAKDTWPICLWQDSKHKVIPDFFAGPWLTTICVSLRCRELIERLDPVQHHYIPLELKMADGRISTGEYFLFKFGNFIDGVALEQSEAVPVYDDYGIMWKCSTSVKPKITWRQNAIKGRHVWADQFMMHDFFCSDEFLNEVEKHKMKLFNKTRSFIVVEH